MLTMTFLDQLYNTFTFLTTDIIYVSFRAFIEPGDVLSLPRRFQLIVFDFQPLINYEIQL
jgi:hypothetical protein